MKRSILAAAICGFAGFGVVGCGGGGGGGGGSGGGTGTVSFAVTDAPFPYDMISQANVVIGEINIRQKGGSDPGFTVISTSTMAYDLVQLQQGKTALVTQAQVPAGTYDQIRLVVLSGTVTLTDGRSFQLTVPSGSSSGLKIKIDPEIVVTTGLSQQLVLDFDLSQSFEPIPSSPKKAADISEFKFHPVVRASPAASSGVVAGKVTKTLDGTAVSGATVTVTNGTITQTTSTGADGTYSVGFLPAGTYTVTATKDGMASASQSATVTTANQVTVNLGI